VYLRDVAVVYNTLGPTTLDRENQNRIVRLTGDVLTDVAPIGVVNDSLRARLAGLDLPEGYVLMYGGEEEAIRESNRQLLVVVLLAVFLVFAVLAVQYESLVNPFVILLAMPLSLVGVGISLRLTETPLSAPVLLGVILLAGIVVNNAILLVEYIEQFRKERDASMIEAAIEAGVIRLRPILMTTVTTMLGMTPLALGLGQGSELMRPLAIAVVGGLGTSALLTLFVVPSAYVIFNTAAEKVRRFLVGEEKVKGAEEAKEVIEAGVPATGD
jgi:multidrug efflux pump subunit AcrB